MEQRVELVTGSSAASLPAYLELNRARLLRDLEKASAPRVVEAFAKVPRHVFVPTALLRHAYDDRALPLISDQTISQPSMIAFMLKQLAPRPTDRALEIGAGCGYAAALLGQLTRRVDTVEIRPELAELARVCLSRANVKNVAVHERDGSKGLEERAPYDCILVSAGAAQVPDALMDQLAPGGRIAIPVNEGPEQVLRVGTKSYDGNGVEWIHSLPCVFVPFVNS
jgi:protein-L-isoaspartate(D-aspartate) O-methyltransferase